MSFFITEFAVKKRSDRNAFFCGLRRAPQPPTASAPEGTPAPLRRALVFHPGLLHTLYSGGAIMAKHDSTPFHPASCPCSPHLPFQRSETWLRHGTRYCILAPSSATPPEASSRLRAKPVSISFILMKEKSMWFSTRSTADAFRSFPLNREALQPRSRGHPV